MQSNSFSHHEKSIAAVLKLISVNNVVMAICGYCRNSEKSVEVRNQCSAAVFLMYNFHTLVHFGKGIKNPFKVRLPVVKSTVL